MKKRLRQLALSSCAAMLFSICVYAQQNVRGTLRSPAGEPLLGATITIKGTNQTTTTDANGQFVISAPTGSTLVVSSVGFQTREIPVTGAEINEVIQVTDATLN